MIEEKYGFVYIWFDKKQKRYYIGAHWGSENDGYICSSSWMKKAYKIRSEDFTRKILSKHKCKKEMFNEETRLLKMAEPKRKRYYNLSFGNTLHWSSNEDSKAKVKLTNSEKSKALHQDTEYREKYLEGIKNRKKPEYTEESKEKKRQKMVKTMAEKFPIDNRISYESRAGSPEHRAKLGVASKRNWESMSDEKKAIRSAKISESNKGLKNRLGHSNSLEHRQKISESQKGKVLSEEHRKKISKAHKGRVWSEDRKAKHSLTIQKMWENKKLGMASILS